MCLYHSPAPHLAIDEIARTLRPHGAAIFVTKAADSYRELAGLLATSGLDPAARERPSLYETAHSGNLQGLTEQAGLRVDKIEHETHTFTFADLAHTAAYLATCPQVPAARPAPPTRGPRRRAARPPPGRARHHDRHHHLRPRPAHGTNAVKATWAKTYPTPAAAESADPPPRMDQRRRPASRPQPAPPRRPRLLCSPTSTADTSAPPT